MVKDDEGHRTYTVSYRVKCNSADGPSVALTATGLPTIGNTWVVNNENDPWAWCTPGVKITPVLDGEPNNFFDLEYTFTTKPLKQDPANFSTNPGSGGGTGSMPGGSGVENPLLIPDRLSGSYSRFTEEFTDDILGFPVVNSSHEQMRGPPVEFDRNRLVIKVEQNRTDLQIALINSLVDCVNDRVMWGLPKRCVKLSAVPWERKYYGNGIRYYTRTLEFEVRKETFDRYVLDEGTKVLQGHWNSLMRWVLDKVGVLKNPSPPQLEIENLADAEDPFPPVISLAPAIYEFRISAEDANGETSVSALTRVASTLDFYSRITVSWTAIEGALTYWIWLRVSGTTFVGKWQRLKVVSAPITSYLYEGTDLPLGIEDLVLLNETGSDPDQDNPSHFARYKDKNGENARVLLDGHGKPAEIIATGTGATTAGSILVKVYQEADLSVLGAPTSL